MWGFIKRWVDRRRERQRALFVFYDGSFTRRVDPARVWRALINHPEMNFEDHMPLADQGQEPEVSIVLKALREIFGVTAWDHRTLTGLTDWETLDLVRQFGNYLDELKKSTDPSRTPYLLSVYGSSTGPEPQDEPTSSTAGSSSTSAASPTGEASPSSEPSPTPS